MRGLANFFNFLITTKEDTLFVVLIVILFGAIGYMIKYNIDKKRKNQELLLLKVQIESLLNENRRNEESHEISMKIQEEELKKLILENKKMRSIIYKKEIKKRHGSGRRD